MRSVRLTRAKIRSNQQPNPEKAFHVAAPGRVDRIRIGSHTDSSPRINRQPIPAKANPPKVAIGPVGSGWMKGRVRISAMSQAFPSPIWSRNSPMVCPPVRAVRAEVLRARMKSAAEAFREG